MNARVPASVFAPDQALAHVTRAWDGDIVRQLTDYIAIPAKSPGFDADWAQHGYIDTVMRNAAAWIEAQKVEGLTLEIVRLAGRTPVLFFEIAASSGTSSDTATVSSQTVLMYGHLDKQPEFTAGATTSARGRPNTRTASCTAGAVPTMVTRCTPASLPCRRSKARAQPTRVSWA